MMPLLSAIRERLLSLPAVTTWVDGRIYTLRFPQSLNAPAIRLLEISHISAMQLRGDVALRRVRVQIDTVEAEHHGDPYANAHAIADAVRGDLTSGSASGLSGFQGDLSGIPIAAIHAVEQRERYDAETHLVRVEQDFVIWFESGGAHV